MGTGNGKKKKCWCLEKKKEEEEEILLFETDNIKCRYSVLYKTAKIGQ